MAVDHELVSRIETLLREINLKVRKKGKEGLSGYGVTPPQFHALLALRDGALAMGELCERMYLAASTITDLVDRMEAAGLVERLRDSLDRRVVRINIKERGRQVLDDVLARRHAYLATVLSEMPGRDVVRLSEILQALHEIMFTSREGERSDDPGSRT